MALASQLSEVCKRLVFEGVNKNSVSKLQLAIRFYSPIQVLTSLAQYNEKGETPFVIAILRRNVSLIKELVMWISKKEVYNNEECKPMVLIIIEQLAHHIPIMDLIDYRISNFHSNNEESTKWLKFIAQFFIMSTSFTRQDKIILLELTGAALIFPLRSAVFAEESVCGLECWREAMTLRYCPAVGQPFLPKLPDVHVPSAASLIVYGSAIEVMTMEELDLLQEDFERNYLSLDVEIRLPCVKRMQIQAHLVIRRISSQANIGHPNWLYLKSLLDFSEVLGVLDSKPFINTYLLILEKLNGVDPKLISLQTLDVSIAALHEMSYFLRLMLREPPGCPGREELTYANLLTPIKFISTIPKHFPENAVFDEIAEIVYRFLFVMGSISHQMTNEEQQTLEKYYYDYIRNTPKRNTTVLHVVLWDDLSDEEDLHFITIKLILKLGADPNAIDAFGQTALHILADKNELLQLTEYKLVFQSLVDAGGHLDMATDDGRTVLSILKENMVQTYLAVLDPYFESLLNTVFPLSCYAARVIRRNRIPYDEDRLPTHLQEFVKRHS